MTTPPSLSWDVSREQIGKISSTPTPTPINDTVTPTSSSSSSTSSSTSVSTPPLNPPSPKRSWKTRIKNFLISQHLPIGLALMTLFGYLVPEPGIVLATTPINTISIVGIFFIAGLNLQTSEIKHALKAVPSYVFGFLSILAISPCLAFLIILWDLGPLEFSRGMALFFAMPTTTSSGVIMTTEAGGNVALSVLMAVGTNLLGVLTTPFFIAAFIKYSTSISNDSIIPNDNLDINIQIDPLDLLWKLALSILLPLLIGKSLQYFTKVNQFVKKYKLKLKLLSSALLILIPWISISTATPLLKITATNPIILMIIVGIALHIVLLIFNYAACEIMNRICKLSIKLPERKAVVINASQKTLNTAVAVIAVLPISVGNKGMITVPCIIAHFAQIIIDAFIVAYWKKFKEEDTLNKSVPSSSTASIADTIKENTAIDAPIIRISEEEALPSSQGLHTHDTLQHQEWK